MTRKQILKDTLMDNIDAIYESNLSKKILEKKIKTKPVENWEKEFEKKFVWQGAPVGLDEDKNYILGEWVGTWADEVSLEDIKQFISSLLSQQAQQFVELGEDVEINIGSSEFKRGYIEGTDDYRELIKSTVLEERKK